MFISRSIKRLSIRARLQNKKNTQKRQHCKPNDSYASRPWHMRARCVDSSRCASEGAQREDRAANGGRSPRAPEKGPFGQPSRRKSGGTKETWWTRGVSAGPPAERGAGYAPVLGGRRLGVLDAKPRPRPLPGCSPPPGCSISVWAPAGDHGERTPLAAMFIYDTSIQSVANVRSVKMSECDGGFFFFGVFRFCLSWLCRFLVLCNCDCVVVSGDWAL